jgi:hypothetical protein
MHIPNWGKEMAVNSDELVHLIVNRLQQMRVDLQAQWNNPSETKTRHFVLDDLLPANVAQQIGLAFPRDGSGFYGLDSFRERKRTLGQLGRTDPVLSAICIALQHPDVIELIGKITNMTALEGDRSLYAGGLSMMFPGDFLNPHIDNSHDGDRARYRRINLLYYVNEDWSEELGGNFELWDIDVTKRKTIVSGFNRLVAMETNRTSWHSVSKVVANRPRCCVSNYYFSKFSPDGDNYFHVTSFTGRPQELVRRFIAPIDNGLRNIILKTFKNYVPGKDRADQDVDK